MDEPKVSWDDSCYKLIHKSLGKNYHNDINYHMALTSNTIFSVVST